MTDDKLDDIDLEIVAGNDEELTFSIMDGSVGAALSGSVYAQGRKAEFSPEYYFDTRSTTGMAIADGTNGSSFAVGKIVLELTAAITGALPTKSRYELINDPGSTTPVTLARGNIIAHKQLVR